MCAASSTPRRSRSQISYQTSPTHKSSKRAFSAAASPRNISSREKRVRRSDSPSSRSSPPATPSKLFDALSTASTPSSPTSLFMNLASSAPTTPFLPSSSSSFFPAISSSTSHNNSQMQPSLPPSPRHSRTMLDDLHREAFTSLRQSLAQSAEGFLRRMRDWEERRNMESSRASVGVQERGRDRPRARRHRTSHKDNHTVSGMSEPHPREDIYSVPDGVSYPARDSDSISGYGTFLREQDDSDIQDDMLIDNVGHSSFLAPKRKPRSGSLGGGTLGVPGSQELFSVDLAETDAERYPSHCTSTFDFPFTYSKTRSSSPFSVGNTTSDESSSSIHHDQPHSGFSSPCAMSSSVDWSLRTISTRNQYGMLGESMHSLPGTSPRPSSPGFSRSLLATRRHMAVQSLDDASTQCTMYPCLPAVSETRSHVPQTAPDKALAALVLTLANGAGSLADYRYVREAQGELEDLEAGGLWE